MTPAIAMNQTNPSAGPCQIRNAAGTRPGRNGSQIRRVARSGQDSPRRNFAVLAATTATVANPRRIQMEGSAAIRCVSPLTTATVPADNQREMDVRSATIDAATCERRWAIGTSSILEAQTRAETELHAAGVSGLRRAAVQHLDVHRGLREAYEAARAEANAVVLPQNVSRVRADVEAGGALLARRDAGVRNDRAAALAKGQVADDVLFHAKERRAARDQDVELLVDRNHPPELQVCRFLLALQTGNRLVKRARPVEDDRARNRSRQSALGIVLFLVVRNADGKVSVDLKADTDIKEAARRELGGRCDGRRFFVNRTGPGVAHGGRPRLHAPSDVDVATVRPRCTLGRGLASRTRKHTTHDQKRHYRFVHRFLGSESHRAWVARRAAMLA